MAYGGDFGDEPNDYNFVMDGLLYSEHTVSSNITEYAKSIEPVQTLSLHHRNITVANRYDFLALDHLFATWSIVSDGKEFAGGRVKIPTGKEYLLEDKKSKRNREREKNGAYHFKRNANAQVAS